MPFWFARETGLNTLSGSLAAKTSAFPKLSLTSHPSVKGELETGEAIVSPLMRNINSQTYAEYIYEEEPVVVDSGLITR